MFRLKVKNIKGAILELTNNEKNYQVTDVDGLNPPSATINTTNYANTDGSSFNSSKITNREIVITIYINGDIEENRLTLYKYFREKQWVKIYIQNSSRNVWIEGYVQTFEVSNFVQKQVAQISVVCPDPYFKDMETLEQDIAKITKEFVFPFSINEDEPIPFSTLELDKVSNIINDSESETGVIITAEFKGNVSKLEIKNTDTGENFIVKYSFIEGDKLEINCNKGSKSVTLIREAVEYNFFPNRVAGSTFFQLGIGDNNFSYLADEGESDNFVDVYFNYYKIYLGV